MRYDTDAICEIAARIGQLHHEMLHLRKVLGKTEHEKLQTLMDKCHSLIRCMSKEIPECNRRGKKTLNMVTMEKEVEVYVSVLEGELLCATMMV